MTGLVNSDGNFMVINQVHHTYTEVTVYESKQRKDDFDAGIVSPFDKDIRQGLNLGEDMLTKMKTMIADGTQTVFENLVTAAESVIVEQSSADVSRHAIQGIPGDWVVYIEIE
jgi:hypothetical protein